MYLFTDNSMPNHISSQESKQKLSTNTHSYFAFLQTVAQVSELRQMATLTGLNTSVWAPIIGWTRSRTDPCTCMRRRTNISSTWPAARAAFG